MNPAEHLKALSQWRKSSLANTFALQAALIAIVSSLMVASISLAVIYWVERASLHEKLAEKSRHVAERVESSIRVLEGAANELARNPLLVTALLDSPGRVSHVVPFLENYKFPIAAVSGLALCDLNGKRLTGMRSPLSDCRASSPLFKQVIERGKTLRELVPLTNGHLVWVVYQGVIFPYTGTVEGIVVTQADLQDILRDIPKDLDLEAVALVRAGGIENLASSRTARSTSASLDSVATALFKADADATPVPLEVVAMDHLSPLAQKLDLLVLGYGIGILFLVVMVAYWTRLASRRLISPLTELTSTAHRIAQTGDLGIDIPRIEGGEVGQLAVAIGVMVNALRISEETLEKKVELRTEELKKSEAAAEAANQAKSSFLANMSHEIRTPLNGVLGMAQMLMMPNLKDAERQDYARTIFTSGQTLLTLLNDILDLSKVEAGKVKLECIVLEPAQIIHETEGLLAEVAGRKNLRLESDWIGPSEQRYLGDPHRLRQMLSNLVGNAIKFTTQGFIRIEAREIESDSKTAVLEFAVTDTGIGIPEDRQSLLFQSFSQTDDSTTRLYGGTGLGLAIVRNFSRLMGGEVGFESEVGKGSRFWFRVRADVLPKGLDSRHAERPARKGPTSGMPHTKLSGRVLVAEDNLTNRKVVDAALKKLGLTVVLTENGQQCLDAVMRGGSGEVILMDLEMPVMDGYVATERIRQWETENRRPHLPIIAFTAHAFEDDRQHCLAAGMDDFLTKPIVIDTLREKLGKWLLQETIDTRPATPQTSAGKPVEVGRVEALLRELDPLLAQNKFDAINRLNELQEVVAGTEVAVEIHESLRLLAEFRFDLVRESLRRTAAVQGWEYPAS